MPIPVHVICGMCGSGAEWMKIKYRKPDKYEGDESGVSFSCGNCGTLTSVEELEGWLKEERDKHGN